MKLMFAGTIDDPVHTIYDPVSTKMYRFMSSQEYDVPDYLGEKLINNFPKKFGKTIDNIKKARGVTILKTPKKTIKKSTKEIKHPTVKAMKKIEDSINKRGK